MRWMCTQDNWKSERSSIAAYCHRRPSHLFAAAPESVHGGWNLEWMQPVKLLEDYQLFIYGFRFVPVAQFTDDLHDRQSQKQYKVSAYLFLHLPLFVCPPPPIPLCCLTAASSFSFCRASLEHTVSAEELSYQLPRRAGGSNLTWHDGRGQKAAHTRTVKLLQQPGTEGIQVYGRSLSGVERWCDASNFQMCFKWEKLIIKGKWRAWCVEAVSNPSVLIRQTGGTCDASAGLTPSPR